MRKSMPSDYLWQNGDAPLGEIYTITFVRGLGDAETLERFSPDPLDIRRFSEDEVMARVEETRGCCDIIGVRRLAGWTVAYEYCGWEGARKELQRELSRDGGEAVTVCRHDYGHDRFSHSVDGEIVTSFDPMFPEDRWGTGPDRLLSHIAELGLDPDRAPGESVANRIAASLALAGRVSGVLVREDDLTWPMLGARITTHVPSDPAAPWRRGPRGGSGT